MAGMNNLVVFSGNANRGIQVGSNSGYVLGNNYYNVPIEESPAKPNPSSTVPFRRDPDFVDRDILTEVAKICSKPASRAALVGLGGVGKSQLAIEYSYRVREQAPQTWIFWVHSSNAARFEEGYRTIADRIKLPRRDEQTADILQLVSDWLGDESNGQWIMILDNADDPTVFSEPRERRLKPDIGDLGSRVGSLSTFIPQTSNGSVLVTTRSEVAALRLTGSYRDIIKVEPMDERCALLLLDKKLRGGFDKGDAIELVRTLDYNPLAISQAAAFIEQRAPQATVGNYLTIFHKSERHRALLLSSDAGDLRRDVGASNSIITTWQISFERIRARRPSAADLLSLMSFFDGQRIPEFLLHDYKDTGDDEKAEVKDITDDENDIEAILFEDDVSTLTNYSLITIEANGAQFEMHRLVQFSTRNWLDRNGELEKWKNKFITIMWKAFPTVEKENWAVCQELFPHAEALLDFQPAESKYYLEIWSKVLGKAGQYATMQGNYIGAEELNRRALDGSEKALGNDHLDTLMSMCNLALVLLVQGKHELAEVLIRRALVGREKALGKKHPNTLISVNDLAAALTSQGKYEEAEKMNREALEGREEALGEEHLDTLMTVSNMALMLQDQGKFEAAEEMERRALKGLEKVLGKEHPNTLASVSNLASVLRAQGKYGSAEVMSRRALDGCEKVLGKEHPFTLTMISNLALVLQDQEKYEAAEEMERRALKGLEKVLGKEHADTLASVSNLALVLRSQGKYGSAEEMSRRALDGYKKALGNEHPNTLTSFSNLVSVLQSQGKHEEAETIIRQALEGREKTLGKDHPEMLATIHSLTGVLQHEGNDEAADLKMGKLPEPEGLTGSSAGQMYLQSPRLYYEKLRSLKGEVYKNSALALSLRSNKAKGQLSPYPEAIKMQIAEWRKAMENENDELFGDISQPESTIRVRSKIHSTVKACQDIIMAAFSNVWRLQKSGFIQTQISILVIDSDRTSVANLLSVSVEEVKALAQIFNKAVHFTENPAEPDLESMVGTLTRNCDKLLSCLHLSTRPPETDFIEGYPNDAACFRCWEDTAHLLDLAVLIYTGAHVDPLIEGMINTAKLFGMFSRIILQTQPLKCLSPLFGDRQAWIFSLIPIIPHDGIYISTSADLFADIWGPMWKVYREDDRSILQYNVGGGSIVPWDHDIGHHPRLKDNERLGHWMTLSSTFSRSNTIEGFNPWLPTGKSPEGDRSEVQDSSEREPEDAAEEDHHNSESEPEDAAEADHDSSESEPEDAAEEDHDSSESELNSSATTYTVGGSSLVPWDHDVEHHPRLKDNERLGHWMTLSSTFSGSNTTEGFNPWLRIGKSPEGDQSAPPPEEKKKAIKLKDAVGRIFIFPFHLCNTWRRMEDLIRQVFRHVKFIGTHVAEGHYDLVGPNGEIILPQDWETMIEPDWTITMHMWPMPEPPPKAEEPPPAEPPPPNAPPTTPTPDLAPETIVIVPPEVQDSSETEPEDAGEEHDSSESEPEYAAEEDQASSDILDLNPRLSSRWNSYATAHPFSGRERLLIGAQASPKLVWNRCICSTHRITHQLKEKHRLHFLNTTRLFHYVDGRNLGIVAGGHGLTLGANITIKTQIGRSWKDVLLELWENSPHARHPRTLENFWGVVISFCTFNARRVRLTELLGTDSITNLLKPFRWSDTCLKEEFESAVSSSDPFALRRLWDNEQNWQEELGKVLLTCLRALCQTGYDANRKELNALWMSLKSTAPKRIVLNPLEHSWAQMLQDSEDSFAVAVVVKKYLGIPSTENEPQSCKQEGGRPTLSRLETAIAINHEIRNSALQRSRMFQEDLDTWRTADHMWRAKWDVSNVNHGETFWIASPKARLKTVCPLTRSHLLLKWDVIKRDQVRGLIGLESDGTRSGHWEYTDDEDRPPVRPIPVHIL